MKQETYVIERSFNAGIKTVWQAITEKEQMKQWYFDLQEFKPEVGFQFSFEGHKDGITYLHLCQVTEVIPGKKLTYSWKYHGYEGLSYVTFELFEETQTRTRLKLTHAGLETFPNNPDFARECFAEGWTSIIGTFLKNYLEKNTIEQPA
ncbi:MAG TPA: SRPBCC domain-containing protein [Flavisolibacter sp.]|nr:SRPBCC domain-containing protein [Flavisolibacter sp.]